MLADHCKKEVHLVKFLPEIIIDALEQLHKLALESAMHLKACCLNESMQRCCRCTVCWQAIKQPAKHIDYTIDCPETVHSQD